MTILTRADRRLRSVDLVLRGLAGGRSPIEPEVVALDQFLVADGVAVDVGAGFGSYTLSFAARLGPAGRVLSFEPLPGPHAFLRRVIRWLGVANVTLSRQALGAHGGGGEMSLPTRHGLPVHGRAFLADDAAGPGSNAEFRSARAVPVALATLDATVHAAGLDRVDVIKIDVEGYEPAVLRGAEWTLQTFRPVLLLEIERRHLDRFGVEPAAVVEWLRAHDYDMATLRDGRWRAVDAVTGHHRNYLFTPR
ncbi:MAG: FkbM family methyltransferase [Nitriliruptor sp.]|nr:MAG: FkbM family methyltransferase [Nitriliruptor sp.]